MDFAPVYLVQRFFYRIADFFHHWYIDGSRYLGHRFFLILQAVDQVFAIKITILHFFEPLYRDYTIIGRILGVIFRTARILIAGVIYLLLGSIFLVIYLLWVLLPVALLIYAARTI
jgi:hypothetical protein